MMLRIHLSDIEFCFGTLRIYKDGVFDLLVLAGIELSESNVTELHEALKKLHFSNIKLLVLSTGDFRYSFDAQCQFANIPSVSAIGFVAKNKIATNIHRVLVAVTTAMMKSQPQMAIHSNYMECYNWLDKLAIDSGNGGR